LLLASLAARLPKAYLYFSLKSISHLASRGSCRRVRLANGNGVRDLVSHGSRHLKVGKLRNKVRVQQNVLGLDVAVDYLLLVQVGESVTRERFCTGNLRPMGRGEEDIDDDEEDLNRVKSSPF